jgi:hypothetical protein
MMSAVLLSVNDGGNGKKWTFLKAGAFQETLIKNYYEVSILSTEKGQSFFVKDFNPKGPPITHKLTPSIFPWLFL